MKNIILQHWTGELDELAERSSASISEYAKELDADYQLLRGDIFDEILTPPMQKLFMLDESFDKYDQVVMLDMDVFVREGTNKNIFEEKGYGRHTPIQDKLLAKLCRLHPKISNSVAPYWGGSIYRLPCELRQKLRPLYNREEILPLSKPYHFEDEGVMHHLASLAGIKSHPSLYLEELWNLSSFEANVHEAHLIHIRTKITPQGPKRSKLENYQDLVSRGVISS